MSLDSKPLLASELASDGSAEQSATGSGFWTECTQLHSVGGSRSRNWCSGRFALRRMPSSSAPLGRLVRADLHARARLREVRRRLLVAELRGDLVGRRLAQELADDEVLRARRQARAQPRDRGAAARRFEREHRRPAVRALRRAADRVELRGVGRLAERDLQPAGRDGAHVALLDLEHLVLGVQRADVEAELLAARDRGLEALVLGDLRRAEPGRREARVARRRTRPCA